MMLTLENAGSEECIYIPRRNSSIPTYLYQIYALLCTDLTTYL